MTWNTLEQPTYRTIEEYVYRALKEAILSGAIPPGSKILIDSTAETLKVSKTPVREALRTLAQDGFVTLLPHVGAVVSSLDEQKVIEIYKVREALEVLAMTEAAQKATPEDIVRLNALLAQMETATQHEEWDALMILNQTFHQTVNDLAEMPHLNKLLDELRDQTERYWRAATSDWDRMQHAYEEHKQIVQMLDEHNTEGMERAVREHLAATAETLVRMWASRSLPVGSSSTK